MSKPTKKPINMWGVWTRGLRGPEFQLVSKDMPRPIEGHCGILKVFAVDQLSPEHALDDIAARYPLEVPNERVNAT